MRGLLDRLAAESSPTALAVAVPYFVALVAVAVEVGWIASREGGRRLRILSSAATASVMALGAAVVGAIYTDVLRLIWSATRPIASSTLSDFWRDHQALGAVAAFVAWDAAGYGYHWIGHRTRIGWAAHSPHHSGQEFDLTLGLRQSWLPVHGLAVHPLLAIAGFDLQTMAICAAVSGCVQVLQHTSASISIPGWVAAVFVTPTAHRHHHGRGAAAVNLGPVLTCWDRLAGTWVPSGTAVPEAYGPELHVRGPFEAEMAGWRELMKARTLYGASEMCDAALTSR